MRGMGAYVFSRAGEQLPNMAMMMTRHKMGPR
jgi:hypothetical protein